jgi:outer membrane protein TolC
VSRVALLLIVALAVPAHATTLKELLDAAEKANVDRRISAEQRRKAGAELWQAWTALLPSLSAQGSWTNNQFPAEFALGPGAPTIVITPKNQLDFIGRVELPLIDTTRWLRAGAASAADDAAAFRDELMVDNVQRQVATTYYGFAAALALQASAKRSLGVAEAQNKLQDIRLSAGAATELEVLRARAEVQRNRQTVADSAALVANARRALLTQTGVDVGTSATLPADNLTPEGSLEEMESKTDQLPAVRAADKDALAASRIAVASRLAVVPIVNAHFTERVSNATGFIAQANSYTAGIGLLWRLDSPTFFGMSAQSSQAEIARLAAERQRLASRDQIHMDWQRLTAAIQKVAAAKTQVESAERAAQVARDRYVAGAATQIDVIQSERDLFSAEVNQIQARTELASSHVALQISSGLAINLQ